MARVPHPTGNIYCQPLLTDIGPVINPACGSEPYVSHFTGKPICQSVGPSIDGQ